MRRSLCVLTVCAFLAGTASATVLDTITDRQLTDRSDAVVVATVHDLFSHLAANGWILTDYHLTVETALKGDVPDALTVTEIGGTLGTRFTMVPDGATYSSGERVLAFLKRRSDGTFFTTGMALGKFEFARSAAGETVVVRHAEGLDDEPARLAEPFENFIRGNAASGYRPVAMEQLHIAANGVAKQYALIDPNGTPVRWFTGTVNFSVNRISSSYDPTPGITAGASAWSNAGASIHLNAAGTSTSSAPANDGTNVIYFGYSVHSAGGVCDGSQACTLLNGTASGTFDGDNWDVISDADIVVDPSASASQFTALITHEFGHSIGIRHSDLGTPSCTSAIMASFIPAIYGSNLQQWDKDAVNSIYGSGPVCSGPPATPVVSGGGTVPAGSTVTLVASGQVACANVTYQWYSGMSGDTSTPVGTNSPNFTTPPVNATANFWVMASNGCGSTPSATITVAPAVCQKPVITIDLQDQTIASGATATLMIGSSGSTPFTYQWYQGQAPDTSNPIAGATGPQFTTPPLTQTAQYWVKVSNSCGSANSRTATITVPGTPPPCSGPPFTVQPSSVTLDSGQQTFLIASADGATAYQWYEGTAPDTSTPLTGLSPSNQRLIDQMYIDLLQRPSDAGGNALAAQIDAHSITRQQAALVVLTSDEYRRDLISQTYTTFLHRAASPAEVAFLLPLFTSGITDEQLDALVLSNTQYFALAGSTNGGWVARVFNDVLGRAPNSSETQFWVIQIYFNSRTAVATAILNSTEARTRLVQSWFSQFLRRSATSSEVSAIVSAVLTDEQAMAGILAGDEYFSFGTILPTGPLSSLTSYWVRATNGTCSTNSNTATVTIRGCAAPSITQQPSDETIGIGGSPSLAVSATGEGPLTYQWYQGNSGDASSPIDGATGATLTGHPINATGTYAFWARVATACSHTDSAAATVTVTCGNPPAIFVNAPSSVFAGLSFVLTLQTNTGPYTGFELQEATASDFSNATTLTSTNGSFVIPAHQGTASTRYYYRARGTLVCDGSKSAYSPVTSVIIAVLQAPPSGGSVDVGGPPCPPAVTPCTATGTVSATYSAAGKRALNLPVSFAVSADQSWITFSPSSGPVPDNGIVTVNYTIDLTKLTAGSTQATIVFTFAPQSGKGVAAAGTTTSTVPVSVSLVTPVTPQPKDSNAPPNTVVLPAVAHADGINSQFQSDVRITNTANQPITYQLTYTPSNSDGTSTGMQTLITVNAGNTVALNDVVKNWYGSGVLGQPGIGTLEIRPMNYAGKTGVSVSFATIASSRTYNTTSNGTFGQYVPAIPLIDFLGNSARSKISLQQVSQSSDPTKGYRTNFGFLEGAGQPVNFVATLLDDKNNVIASRPYTLRPFELQQVNLSSFFPGVTIADGRLEINVTSNTGKVTAYASVLDNVTSDPLLIFPVDPSKVSARRFVVPGVAEVNPGAANNFHTDMRIYNGGSSAANVTLTFPSNPALAPVVRTLAAGEVWAIDNVLPALWNITGGGAVVATTDNGASLVVTARTYSRRDDGGTFGQFIPGVTAADAIGVGDRALQIVQLEQSDGFRTNVGLVEVTGNPVAIDVAAFTPDSKVAAHTQFNMNPGEFRQLGSIFSQMGITSNFYNGRIAVTVLGGTGRVAAYGSVVDNRTQDPTYIPAQ